MANSGEILAMPSDFKDAIESFSDLIEEFNSAYKKIVSSNTSLAAAWNGESGNKFREQATILEEGFLQNTESLKTILIAKLQYAVDQLIREDEAAARFIQQRIQLLNIGNENVQAEQASN